MCTLIDRFDEHDGRSLIHIYLAVWHGIAIRTYKQEIVGASDLHVYVCTQVCVWGGYVVNTIVCGEKGLCR